MLFICALAQWKGDKPERLGAAFALAGAIASIPVHMYAPKDLAPLLLLGADALLAAGFLLLAIRYASLWLGAAMIFQAGQFALHAVYTAGEIPHDLTYSLINNLITFAIFAAILIATLTSWRRRRLYEADPGA
jgi:hypothetical protein